MLLLSCKNQIALLSIITIQQKNIKLLAAKNIKKNII